MYKHFLTSVLLVFFMLSCSKPSPFEGKMRESVQTSLSWRNDTTGIWETAGWWNSANVLTATIRYGAVTKDPAIPSVIEDVFEKARHYQVGVDSTGTPRYCDNFINDYYDDEGWWALAWIEASKLEAQILLDDAIAFCQRDGQSDRLVNMLSQSTPVELDDESLYIEAPSRFAVAFLEKNRSVVEAYLEEIAFMPISLVVQAPAGSHTGAVRPTIPAAPAAAQDTPVMATTEVPRPHQTNAMPEAIAANAAGVDMPQMAAPHMAVEPVEKPIENPFDLEAAFAKPRVTVESDAAGFATAPGPMSFAPAGEHGGVNVTNTMSRDQFNRMFAQMKGVETGQTVQKKSIEPAGSGAPMTDASDQPVANPIGSKFTFDNFVYGDENKLAYHSAMRGPGTRDPDNIDCQDFLFYRADKSFNSLIKQ